jgi:hypothetical protein
MKQNNDIINTGIIPESWRKIKTVPILKPGKKPNKADSYRPISLSFCVRKLFERIILTIMDYWAERYEMLSPTQYGFRKDRRHSELHCNSVNGHFNIF